MVTCHTNDDVLYPKQGNLPIKTTSTLHCTTCSSTIVLRVAGPDRIVFSFPFNSHIPTPTLAELVLFTPASCHQTSPRPLLTSINSQFPEPLYGKKIRQNDSLLQSCT